MATAEEIKAIALNWSLVVTSIPGYEGIGFVPKGAPDTLPTLLANWSQAPIGYDEPTEAQLLTALAVVEGSIADEEAVQAVENGAESQAAGIPNFATWTEAEMLTWVDDNVGDTPIDAITNLAEAKALMKKQATFMRASARFTAAFRNKLFPKLQDSS